jgi:hypothetical protein
VTWGRSIAAGLERFAVAQAPQRLCRFAVAQAARAFHFFCPNKRNETKKIRRLHFLGYSGKCFR